jgi:hypothetical protein
MPPRKRKPSASLHASSSSASASGTAAAKRAAAKRRLVPTPPAEPPPLCLRNAYVVPGPYGEEEGSEGSEESAVIVDEDTNAYDDEAGPLRFATIIREELRFEVVMCLLCTSACRGICDKCLDMNGVHFPPDGIHSCRLCAARVKAQSYLVDQQSPD